MFELIQSERSGAYYFRVRLEDGTLVLTSEGYQSKTSSKDAIRSLVQNFPEAKQYDVQKTGDGKAYFYVKAANGKVLATSRLYDSRKELANHIHDLRHSKIDMINDLTN